MENGHRIQLTMPRRRFLLGSLLHAQNISREDAEKVWEHTDVLGQLQHKGIVPDHIVAIDQLLDGNQRLQSLLQQLKRI